MKKILLEDLLGKHILTGVDFENPFQSEFKNSNVIRFRLDNIVYAAIENPCDDYRSMLDCLVETEDNIKNIFIPCNVICQLKENSEFNNYEVLEIIDMVTGKIIIEVGTDCTDDYYPNFVNEYYPEAMFCNLNVDKD